MSSGEDAADDTPYESDDRDEDSGVDETRSDYSDDRMHSYSDNPHSGYRSSTSPPSASSPLTGQVNYIEVESYARPVNYSPSPHPSRASSSDGSSVAAPQPSRPTRRSRRGNTTSNTHVASRRSSGTNPRRVAQHQAEGIPDLSAQVTISRDSTGITGTYSTVYRGVYRSREVAVKVVRGGRNSRSSRRQFRRELETWWHLNHPNILKLYGFAEGDGFGQFGAMVSPWCRFGSADVQIRRGLPAIQGLSWFRDVAEGLRYLHTFTPTVIHGDLKPANVLIDGDYTAKITDFGLVRLIHEGEASGLTTTTAFTGTPRYYSYELVIADNPLSTTASDVHALGCVGMELIYSRSPYGHIPSNYPNATYKICHDISKGIPPASRPTNITYPITALWSLFEACWKYYPRDRPSANDICQYLETHGQPFAQALKH